jgi:adenylate kinase
MLALSGRALTHVLLFDVPEEELVRRLSGRRTCRACGKGYHLVFDPPRVDGVCDKCGGELFQRDDDNEATVRNRLAVYGQQTEPLVGYYAAHGLLHTFHGGGRMPDEVFADVQRLLSRS